MGEDTHLAVLYSDAENTQFALQHGSNISIYEVAVEETLKLKRVHHWEGLDEIECRIHSAMSNDIANYVFLVDQKHFYKINCKEKERENLVTVFKN